METLSARPALLTRSAEDRVIAGVAAGAAERLRIDPIVVRLALVVLAFAGGFGVIVYLAAWLLSAEPKPHAAPPEPAVTTTRRVIAVSLVVAGAMVVLREAGIWFGDAVAWSVGLVAFGSAILWARTDSGRARFARLTSRLPRTPSDLIARPSKGRVLVGAVLVVAGLGIFLGANTSLAAIRVVAFAVIVTALGLGLVLAPWMRGVVRQLGSERRERIRSEERAEMAAHLHDSVLQTLAMIQRAPSREDMTALARIQERELRSWLYGRTAAGDETLRRALEMMAARIESQHRVRVEAVAVGDVAVDDRIRALIDAAGEATTNAAKHSHAAAVAVFAEVEDGSVDVYVRDEGVGFDPSANPVDRRGISESIVGRMERNGGTATVSSTPSEGTEVHLHLPRRYA